MHLCVVGTVSSINNTVGEAPDTQIKLPRSTHMTFTEKNKWRTGQDPTWTLSVFVINMSLNFSKMEVRCVK